MKPLSRKELTVTIARKLGVKCADVRLVVEEIFAVLYNNLSTGRSVEIRGFGTIVVKPHGGGVAHSYNTKTKTREFLEIPPHQRLVFRPFPKLKAAVLKVPLPLNYRPRRTQPHAP